MSPTDTDRYLEYRANPRLAIWRQALIYVPIAVFLGGLLVVAVQALPNSIIGVIVLVLFGIPVAIVGIQALADLFRSQPMTSRGTVDRQFSKGRFLIFGRVYYLLAEMRSVGDSGEVDRSGKPKRRLFEVEAASFQELEPGDEIEVVHWPHTNAIRSVEKIASSESLQGDRQGRSRPADWASWDELDRGPRTPGWPHQ